MHRIVIFLLAGLMVAGCSSPSPVTSEPQAADRNEVKHQSSDASEYHWLWGQWTLYISESRDRVEVVPTRDGAFHLNALKFLETECPNCVEITKIKNNGDSTIDLTVRLRHPFPGYAEYTGFDVKGIVMFNGSYQLSSPGAFPGDFHISWRLMGDPELLNPDGYSIFWSPSYDSGSPLPILNYWAGKYSSGTPTANINAYLNFYNIEDRHIFTSTGVVNRVYHLYLPPGPLTVGYAVDACWAPPTKTPVINPVVDFPVSANQKEPYHFRFVLNNDLPITQGKCCGLDPDDPCADFRIETLQWYGPPQSNISFTAPAIPPDQSEGHVGAGVFPCQVSNTEWLGGPGWKFSDYPDGTYRSVAIVMAEDWQGDANRLAYTLFDWTVDKG